MTNEEFSNEFDVLYNSITSNQAPGLDEYEKSVFLTKAQSDLLREYFNAKVDATNGGFDGSQKRQYDFSTLIRVANLFNVNTIKERVTADEKIDRRSLVFCFPEDYFLSVNEIVFDNNKAYSVLPISYDNYQNLMLKPYTMPVKKGVWRLFTDKKNCNYVQEYINNTDVDYKILSTWADQKRNLSITIKKYDWDSSYAHDTFTINGDTMYYRIGDYSVGGVQVKSKPYQGGVTEDDTTSTDSTDSTDTTSSNYTTYMAVTAECGWSSDKMTYNVVLEETNNQGLDDKDVLQYLKEGFGMLKEYMGDNFLKSGSELVKAATHIDSLYQAEAPSKFYYFASKDSTGTVYVGKTFTTNVIQLPLAEIIGKISDKAEYHLRYIRKPNPIILADFTSDDVTIEGQNRETQCELPSQLHQEILERAVTLAKIAYQAGTTNTLANQQRAKEQ